ncbi:MAG: beta-ACP synthase, partial [Bacteroides sp.]|nr:beta-ACP synthase [Bacteroides sp.]
VPVEGYTRLESCVIRAVGSVQAQSGVRLADQGVRLILSSTKGNIDRIEQCGDELPEEAFLGTCARRIADYFSASMPPLTVSNACISGVSAMVVGQRLIRNGLCDSVIIVGCDTLSLFIAEGFRAFKSVSGQPCRPYDKDRDGLSLGEACGALLLTIDRSKALEPAVELAGGAVTNDANHISGPSRTGDGLYLAIRNAMRQAGIGTDDVALVNTHGTATLYNDEMESKAIAWAGLDKVPLNSLKGYIGHTLGASGVVEAVVSAQELREGIVFGTKGFSQTGVPCSVNVFSGHVPVKGRSCVKTASGFGGCNAAVVLSLEGAGRVLPDSKVYEVQETDRYVLPQSGKPFAEFIREEFKKLQSPNMKFYKMSDLSKAAYVAAEHLQTGRWQEKGYAPEEVALILANRSASLDTDLQHQRILDEGQPISPAVFVYTLPNVAAGELCIRHKIQGDNTFFIEDQDSGLADSYARLLVAGGYVKAAVCGWCDFLNGKWEVSLKLLERK